MKQFIIGCFLSFMFSFSNYQLFSQAGSFKVIKTFHIQSEGGWDYLAVNGKYLYVSHGTQVNILDKQTGDSIGVIPNTTGVHGIAFIPGLNKGYTSNGRLNNVTVFELSTNKILSSIATGQNPDAIMYEPWSKHLIVCNGRSNDLTVIDPATEKVVATIPVGGKPETAVSNEAGIIYVNVEDKNEIVEVDLSKNAVMHHWSLTPAEAPTGLAIDIAGKRLFAGCEKLLVVLDATNGKIVDTKEIGDGCDGVAYDPSTKTIFTSNGVGTMTVIKEKTPDNYDLLEHVITKRGARTITIDQQTHLIYLPTAEFGPPVEQGKRPAMIPGTFQVLVIQENKN